MTCTHEIIRSQEMLKRVFEGIYALLNKQLHPGLIKSESLTKKIEAIRTVAEKRNQHITITKTNEVYLLDTSYIVTEKKTIIAMFHIPLFHCSTVMDLYKYIPTPSLTKINITDGKATTFEIECSRVRECGKGAGLVRDGVGWFEEGIERGGVG